MSISSKLAKQFASITNDKKNESRATTVYGIVRGDETNRYVVLDGSDVMIPLKEAMGSKPGDRVMVDVSNHEAVVVGNISQPAVVQSVLEEEETGFISKIEQASDHIIQEVQNTGTGEITKIMQTASRVTTEIENKGASEKTKLEQTAKDFQASVTDTKNGLQTQITANATAITGCVKNSEYSSKWAQTAEGFIFTGKTFNVNTDHLIINPSTFKIVTDTLNIDTNKSECSLSYAIENPYGPGQYVIREVDLRDVGVLLSYVFGTDGAWGIFPDPENYRFKEHNYLDILNTVYSGTCNASNRSAYADKSGTSDSATSATTASRGARLFDIATSSDGSNKAALRTYFTDNAIHEFITKDAADGELHFGYANVNLYLRGSACKIGSKDIATTSDRNLKKDILEFDERFDHFFDKLEPITYKYVNGNSGRKHSGYIAQQVEEALISSGITLDEYGCIEIDEISSKNRETETNDEGIEEDIPKSDINYLLDKGEDKYYTLKYNEFQALNTWQIQKLKARVTELEEKNKSLEERIARLEALLT